MCFWKKKEVEIVVPGTILWNLSQLLGLLEGTALGFIPERQFLDPHIQQLMLSAWESHSYIFAASSIVQDS